MNLINLEVNEPISAPTGAQGMLMSVCVSSTNLSRTVNIHLS